MMASVFYRAGLIETWGRGIEKIITACHEEGKPEPLYIPAKKSHESGKIDPVVRLKLIHVSGMRSTPETSKNSFLIANALAFAHRFFTANCYGVRIMNNTV